MKKYRTKLQKINRRKKYYDEICSWFKIRQLEYYYK
jgi:hypothetical protein